MQLASVTALFELIALLVCFCCAAYTVKLTALSGAVTLSRGQFWNWTLAVSLTTAICVAWTFWLLFIKWSLQTADNILALLFVTPYLLPSVFLIFIVNLGFLTVVLRDAPEKRMFLALVATGLWSLFMATASPVILIKYYALYDKATKPDRIAFNNQCIIDMSAEARMLDDYVPAGFSCVNNSTHPYEHKGTPICRDNWMKWSGAHGNLMNPNGSWLSNGPDEQPGESWGAQTQFMLERIKYSLDDETYAVYLGTGKRDSAYIDNAYLYYDIPVVVADGGDHFLGFEVYPMPNFPQMPPMVEFAVFPADSVLNMDFLTHEFVLRRFADAIDQPIGQLLGTTRKPDTRKLRSRGRTDNPD